MTSDLLHTYANHDNISRTAHYEEFARMAHEADPTAPTPAFRINTALARDCHDCGEWGTVINAHGHDEPCPSCQRPGSA
ncbi:hypothetical protein GCM10010393_27730 [Streptomyces gobitricini]|uniref:Uncharacterized protein n=1 Tax=Streptomyces gobitricini TaxID=68211 RepID=A0ABN3M1C5_9ACTN